MKEKVYEIISNIYCILFLLILFICNILYYYGFINGDIISGILIAFGVLGLIIYLANKVIYKKVRIYDLIVLLIYLFCCISYKYAFDKKVAMWGFFGGREGMFVIFSYYIIFLVFSTLRSLNIKDLIFKILTFEGLVQVIYGLLQVFGVENVFGMPILNLANYSSGLYFNSNFMGSCMVLMLGLWLPKLLLENGKLKDKIIDFIFTFIFVIGLLSCGTMSAFVAMICLIIMAIVYYIVKRKKYELKKVILRIVFFDLIVFSSLLILTNFTGSKLNNDIEELENQFVGVISGKSDESYGTGRFYIWRETFKYLPKYIWTGIGIDNFTYLGFSEGTFIYDSDLKNNIITKAHNEYLNILANGGIFLLLSYLALIGTILFKFSKRIFKNKKLDFINLSFYFAFCGYLVQAFFNVRITLIAPIFFLIAGLLVSQLDAEEKV